MPLLNLLRTSVLTLVLSVGAVAAPSWAQTTPAAAPASTQPAASEITLASVPAITAAPAASSDVRKETIDNPYGLAALWAQGDFVAKGTLIAMILMSMGSWYILFTKLAEQQRLFRHAKDASEDFWRAASVDEGVKALSGGSVFRYIAEQGLKSAQHHEGTLVERIDLHTWISMSIQRAVERVQSRLQGGLAFLATVGSTAPFVGLFGTVWGIYHALTAIGISGQASIDKVAGPVGETLIMTAFGLGVAVPAVMGYNLLIRRNKLVMEHVRSFAGDLHNVLIAGKK